MMTYHYWAQVLGESVGHASLEIAVPSGAAPQYVSFWPAEGSDVDGITGVKKFTSGAHSYDDDVKAEGRSPDKSRSIDFLDEPMIVKKWADIKRHEKYSLYGYNCSTCVVWLLWEAGGRYSPRGEILFNQMGIWSPMNVLSYVDTIWLDKDTVLETMPKKMRQQVITKR